MSKEEIKERRYIIEDLNHQILVQKAYIRMIKSTKAFKGAHGLIADKGDDCGK